MYQQQSCIQLVNLEMPVVNIVKFCFFGLNSSIQITNLRPRYLVINSYTIYTILSNYPLVHYFVV